MPKRDLTPEHQQRYGEWAGNPEGNRPDPERCAKEVVSEYYFHQCLRKRGHGPHGAYCKQHARKLGHDA
jgi:hypothetical protein